MLQSIKKAFRLFQGIEFSHIHYFQFFWGKAGDTMPVAEREIEVDDRKASREIMHVWEDRRFKDMNSRKSQFQIVGWL